MTTPDWVDLLGYAAASLTTASFVPQAWLSFRTGDVSGISLGMYASFTVGVALWLAYGVVLGALVMGIFVLRVRSSVDADIADLEDLKG